MKISLEGAWLDVDLPEEHHVLSWAILGGGLARARRISWRQVTDADLPAGVDPVSWIVADMQQRSTKSDVVLLTSRRITAWERVDALEDGAAASAVVTVGLSNAVRVGTRAHSSPAPRFDGQRVTAGAWVTLNVLCCVDRPLSVAALVEALSIATEARTLALLERRLLVDGEPATGTGTDCVVVAAPLSAESSEPYAGKHTAVGCAIGRSVFDAVGRGADRWLEERRRSAGSKETVR